MNNLRVRSDNHQTLTRHTWREHRTRTFECSPDSQQTEVRSDPVRDQQASFVTRALRT